MSRSPRQNHVGSTRYDSSSVRALHVSSLRPHPRSTSMPSPRVYITVSRSGQTLSPWIHQSSAVLATTVTSVSADPPGTRPVRRPWRRPWTNLAPPTPPERTVTRLSGAEVDGGDDGIGPACRKAIGYIRSGLD